MLHLMTTRLNKLQSKTLLHDSHFFILSFICTFSAMPLLNIEPKNQNMPTNIINA